MRVSFTYTFKTQVPGQRPKTYRFRGHSPLIAWIDGHYVHLSAAIANIFDTGGTSRAIDRTAGHAFAGDGPAGDTSYGPVVGTGTTAVVLTDYKLQTLIAHGVAATQLQYAATTNIAPITTGSTRKFVLSRALTNSSGASITITEVGLYGKLFAATVTHYFCFERTVLGTSVTVLNGTSTTMTVSVSITV